MMGEVGDLPAKSASYGAYSIERELGRGGMGVVYEAVHDVLGRRAAVKVLLADVSRDSDLVERFINEARAASTIHHPSIVEVYDVGRSDEDVYIVMELLQGESLATRLKARGALPIAVVLDRARQCANALEAAHKAGIVHRDLKPDNVFLVPDSEVPGGERVKLLDFGVAKLVGSPTSSTARTVTGAILGTPHYMSPEQCEGAREVDHRSDLYSLGCMIFQMATGRLPFQSAGVGGLIGMHLHVEPPTVRSLRPDVPDQLDALVTQLLAKSPHDRPDSATEVAAALAAITPGPSATMPARIRPPTARIAPNMPTVSTMVSADTMLSAPREQRRPWLIPVIVGAVAVVAVLAILWVDDGEVYSVDSEDFTVDVRDDVTPPPIETRRDEVPAPSPPVPDRLDRDKRASDAFTGMRRALEQHRFADVDKAYAIVVANTEVDDVLRTVADRMADDAKARRPRPPTADELRRLKEADDTKRRAELEQKEKEKHELIRRREITGALDRIRMADQAAVVVQACFQLAHLDRDSVPWERCVQSQCEIDPALVQSLAFLAPGPMHQRLIDSCPGARKL
jgi:serine/threonine protein kinase